MMTVITGRSGRVLAGLGVGLVVLGLDWWTKQLALAGLAGGPIVVIPGWFALTLTANAGVAFGLLANLPEGVRLPILLGGTGVAMGILAWLLWQVETLLPAVGLGMVLGGALGNWIDRARWGMVVDFFHFYWHEYSYPVFNVADSAITVGVGLVLLDQLILSRGSES